MILKMFPKATIDREINGYIRFNVGEIVVSEAMELMSNCPME